MARVEGEITIHRPVEAVFDFFADETNEPRYNPSMLRAERISDGPIGKGTRFATDLKMMGRTIAMTVEFMRFERPWLLASTTRSSAVRTEGELTFEPVDGGTRMRWSWDVRPHSPLKLITPLIGRFGRRQEQAIWGELKRLLQSQAPGGAEGRHG
jgi:uncharacterized protein YndB with AHSA1/START domain